MPKVTVDLENCNGCGKCADVCSVDVFKLKNKKSIVVNEKVCIGCKSCEAKCPEKAIRVGE